ncbi:MAG: 5-(carboxyamino)imidazole ribonucleotide synthase [Thiotrichaceae bacterium]
MTNADSSTPMPSTPSTTPILPGATIGMLGGGQLGRMFTIAAKDLGYRVCVVEPDIHSPAGQLADEHIIAPYDDEAALQQLANTCDVVTTEFENISAPALQWLAEKTLVRPSAEAVEKAQDRIIEKAFIRSCGLLTAPYGAITTSSEIAIAVEEVEFPCLLKTARFGYDGKGQVTVHNIEEVREAYAHFNSAPCVLEQRIDLEIETSVVLGRNSSGEAQCFPVAENIHIDGILHKSIVPPRVDETISKAAQTAAIRIADKLNYIGVLAVEFFVSKQGELLVNEIAPRTHNSGHYSLDACITSQFEQQVRMVCNLPFGDTSLLSPVVMVNMLGDLWGDDQPNWHPLLSSATSKLHLYGKKEARPGRKMGHYCVLANDVETANHNADAIFTKLPSITTHSNPS